MRGWGRGWGGVPSSRLACKGYRLAKVRQARVTPAATSFVPHMGSLRHVPCSRLHASNPNLYTSSAPRAARAAAPVPYLAARLRRAALAPLALRGLPSVPRPQDRGRRRRRGPGHAGLHSCRLPGGKRGLRGGQRWSRDRGY